MITTEEELIKVLNSIRENKLNLSAALVLLIIYTTGVCYQKDIPVDFSIAKLSKNISKLVDTGMIQTVQDNEDTRLKILFITQSGKKLLKSLLLEREREE